MDGPVNIHFSSSGASGNNQAQQVMQGYSRQENVLHLEIIVFWQAKSHGQAAHDVHGNSVHFVHERQHSFSAPCNARLWKLQVWDADYAQLLH